MIRCPNCGARSWFEEIDSQIAQRCLCGLMRFIAHKTENGYEITRRVVASDDVRLPPRDTKLYQTLLCVAESYPGTISTTEVSVARGQNTKETASMLTLLMSRGLLNRAERRRGITGGSYWSVSPETERMLRLRERKHGA